ncbi:MAG: hypothetical protein ACR2NT_02760 [Acidimicrobiia bacterium]
MDIPDPEALRARQEQRETLIASLDEHPGMVALREALVEAEEEWLRRVARTFIKSNKEVDQRKIDQTRGHFLGSQHWLVSRVKAAREWVEKEQQS